MIGASAVSSLTTSMADNNGSQGNIFDVNALQDVQITGLDINTSSNATGTLEVWWRTGSGYLAPISNAGWTLHETIPITGAGASTPTAATFSSPISLTAGQTYSFFVLSDIGIRYITGSTQGAVYAADAALEITEGIGCVSSFTCTYTPRVWSGTLHYAALASSELDHDSDGFVECTWVGTDPLIIAGDDCDDANSAVFPGGTELCDGIDNDCDGFANIGGAVEVDADGDLSLSCVDCDDTDAAAFPGNTVDATSGECMVDLDGDTFGDANAGAPYDPGTDCDDTDADRFPGNAEVCDGVDNDCDEVVPVIETIDSDSDTYPDCYDCDSANDEVYPGASEICDGLDSDCDGSLLGGNGGPATSLTTTFANGSGSSGNIFDIEVLEDISITGFDGHLSGLSNGTVDVYWKLGSGTGSNNNSSADWTLLEVVSVTGGSATGTPTPVPLSTPLDLDAGETYSIYFFSSIGIRYTLGTSVGTVAAQDANLRILEGYGCGSAFSCTFGPPSGARLWNGTIYYQQGGSLEADDDLDGFVECSPFVGTNTNLSGGDCDDDAAAVYPGAPELCDFIDNDCDLVVDEGHDQDSDGQNACDGDCDDADPNNFLGNVELCDGADNDCDGAVDDQDVIAQGGGADTAFPDAATGAAVVLDAEVTVDAVIVDVDVYVDISHAALQEVSLVLISPAGTRVDLSTNNGGSDADYTDTVFDDQALLSIVGASAPMTGTYYPEGFLADFNGESTVGTWRLELSDSLAASDNGVIHSWSVTLTTDEDADDDGYSFCNVLQPSLEDCDDDDDAVYPGAIEACNGEDDDCDAVLPADELDADSDGVIACADCDDGDATVFPGNLEVCDGGGLDNDCDASTDDDVDGDGDGDSACDGDCDDTAASIYVGATEACNGLDDDCNGSADADVAGEVDGDGDGVLSCGDCDDTEAAVFPGNLEVCDNLDNDCDSTTDETQDGDWDGSSPCTGGDCDDTDGTVFVGATELCDGQDNDCDGVLPADEIDVDGDGSVACADCDDADAANYPGNSELCDGQDNDCDALTSEALDIDGDLVSACGGDCDESEITVYPGAPELCDTLDNDCNAATDEALDGDGDGLSSCDGDCDDGDAAILPGAAEACDGEDSDCDGGPGVDEVDVDLDGVLSCDGDCDDDDASVAPGLPEECDGIDNNCVDGIGDEELDADDDGLSPCEGDCDDTSAASLPGGDEICDGLDNDCDTVIPADEADADGDQWRLCDDDCDDAEAAANPGGTEDTAELCADAIDNDCDGDIDEADGDCDNAGDDDDSAGDDDDASGDDDDSSAPSEEGCQCESSLVAGRGVQLSLLLLLLVGIMPLRRRR